MDIFKMLEELFKVDENEIKKDIAMGFSIAMAAGLAYGVKKIKEISQNSNLINTQELQPLLNAVNVLIERHRKLKAMSNEEKRPANVKLKLPPKKKNQEESDND